MNSPSRVLLHGVLLIAPIAISFPAIAAENVFPAVKAESGWYYHGFIEAGGRAFIERPPSGFGRAPAPDNWLTPRTSESRAKFEEYGEIPPGFFADTVRFWGGTRDGLYGFDFLAKNIGLNNQAYFLDLSKAGEHYLSLGWDQTPHLISTSAKTIFSGAGSTNLTVNDTLQTNLQANQVAATAGTPAGVAARTAIEGFINNAATSLDLGTQRDKATAAYKFTPDSKWEFSVDYSHENRTGTRPVAINWGSGFPTNIVEAIQPIDDRTQNVNVTGQYVGTSPWGKRWIASLKYTGSFYDNDLEALNAENPFCLTTAGTCRANLRLALAPSNSANAFMYNSVIDLPWDSRYTGTTQYNMMRQNESFVDTSINGLVPPAFPASSANAEVNTLLSNNVLTTRITRDLKSTLRYRYYDYDNNTPELTWPGYIRADGAVVASPRRNLAIAYTKQNASGELDWRALNWLNVGASFGWERYDRTRREANVTDEYSGKVYADANLWDAAHARGSILYAQRRYDRYDVEEFVEDPSLGPYSENLTAMRKFDMANRDRLKIETFVEIPITNSLTVTPTFGLRNDRYPADVVNQLGVSKDYGWNGGIDISARINPALLVSFSYNYEERQRDMSDCCGGAAGGLTASNIWSSEISQHYHTYIAALDWKPIPERLDFRFEYLLALGSEANETTPCSSGAAGCTGGGTGVTTTQFPTEKNNFQRFSAITRYHLPPEIVRQMGWIGDVTAKLRYTYERNSMENWAIDNMTPYIPTPDQTTDLTGGGRSIFLAYANPNYTAQIIAVTLAAKW